MTIIEAGEPPIEIEVETVELVIEPGGSAATATASVADYVHMQTSPASTWTINHNLGRVVTVTLYTVGSMEMIAEVIPVTTNQAVAIFAEPTAGYARVI